MATTRPTNPDLRGGGRAFAAALAISGLLVAAPSAAQQPAAPVGVIDHDAIFQRGLAVYEAGKLTDAIGIWEQLVQTLGDQRGWKVLYNLGLAYQRVGDPTRAVARFEAFVARAAQQPLSAGLDERMHDAGQRAAALRAAHGEVHVRAPATGVILVRVGTAEPRPAGFTVFLAPGQHEIELSPGSPQSRRVTLHVDAGVVLDVEAEADAPKATPPTAPLPAPREKEEPRRAFPTAWLLVGAGVTVAAAALPTALGLRASAKHDDAERLGVGNTAYASAVDEFGKARTAYYFSYALPAAFAVATAVVVVLKLSARPSGTLETALATGLAGGRF